MRISLCGYEKNYLFSFVIDYHVKNVTWGRLDSISSGLVTGYIVVYFINLIINTLAHTPSQPRMHALTLFSLSITLWFSISLFLLSHSLALLIKLMLAWLRDWELRSSNERPGAHERPGVKLVSANCVPSYRVGLVGRAEFQVFSPQLNRWTICLYLRLIYHVLRPVCSTNPFQSVPQPGWIRVIQKSKR